MLIINRQMYIVHIVIVHIVHLLREGNLTRLDKMDS